MKAELSTISDHHSSICVQVNHQSARGAARKYYSSLETASHPDKDKNLQILKRLLGDTATPLQFALSTSLDRKAISKFVQIVTQLRVIQEQGGFHPRYSWYEFFDPNAKSLTNLPFMVSKFLGEYPVGSDSSSSLSYQAWGEVESTLPAALRLLRQIVLPLEGMNAHLVTPIFFRTPPIEGTVLRELLKMLDPDGKLSNVLATLQSRRGNDEIAARALLNHLREAVASGQIPGLALRVHH